MGKNIVLLGDSHAFFYTQIFYEPGFINAWHDLIANGTRPHDGGLTKNIDGNNLFFLWKIGKTAYTANQEYFNHMIDTYANGITDIDTIIFQFGTADINVLAQVNNNPEECIERLLLSVIEFSNGKPWKPVITIPITHRAVASQEFIKRWNDYLVKRCLELELRLINVFDIIDKNFDPCPGDWNHLNRVDSARSLKYILDQI